jgi:hypothetical protein
MPAQTVKSGILSKFAGKLNGALARTKNNEVSYGIQDLPGGIVNGTAKLTECKFDLFKTGDNSGQPYFLAMGVVVSPDSVKLKDGSTVPVRGLYTRIMIGLVDGKDFRTGKPVPVDAENGAMARVVNEMKKLGADPASLGDVSELETLAAALKHAGPTFRFSTREGKPTQQYPTPKVFESWGGVVEFHQDEDAGAGVDDQTGEAGAEDQGDEGATDTADEATEYRDDTDLTSLGDRAEAGDEDAQKELVAFGKKAGLTQKQIDDDYKTWVALATKLAKMGDESDDDDEDGDHEGPTVPEKGTVYGYKGLLPGKTKKQDLEVEVTKVNSKSKTADAKWTTNGNVKFDAIPWTELTTQ